MKQFETCPADDVAQTALRAAICLPTRRYLWVPSDEIEFTPALSNTRFGDGRALLHLTTINSRPAFYVLRIDSRWRLHLDCEVPTDAPELVEFIDDICFALEDEFGNGRPDDDDDDEEVRQYGMPWPALDDRDGCSWGRADWPDLDNLSFVPHPYAPYCRILAPGNAARERLYS